ncbi:MAG TPA: sigma-70 family RNA polymerase sigma factor [Thermoanaerobaculia bacterium]|nr:sigma-70 family RNA polymerase sigma factor [Thermoanaerobaculia bacterium]
MPTIETIAPPAEDAAFLNRFRAGDRDAFADLVRRNTDRLLAVARRMLRQEQEAEDAVQEAFLSAFRALDRFEGGCRLSTWLHRITINACLMRMRRRGRKPEESIEDLLPRFQADGHPVSFFEPWSEGADVALERTETRLLVRRLIDRLPETYRTALLLRDIEDLGNEEAACLLGITPNAMKIRVHRARQALRTLLEPHLSVSARAA